MEELKEEDLFEEVQEDDDDLFDQMEKFDQLEK